MSTAIPEVTTDFLQAFADAWNRHDIDALMSFMADDCAFESSAGPDICGTRDTRSSRRERATRANATFSRAERCGKSLACCPSNTTPRCCGGTCTRALETSAPSTRT